MKDKTITVRVPDFCPEDCPEFEIHEEKLDPDYEWEIIFSYHCENEDMCRMLHKQLETRYCADCRDAMKARGKI